jgi:hypothetical protein
MSGVFSKRGFSTDVENWAAGNGSLPPLPKDLF